MVLPFVDLFFSFLKYFELVHFEMNWKTYPKVSKIYKSKCNYKENVFLLKKKNVKSFRLPLLPASFQNTDEINSLFLYKNIWNPVGLLKLICVTRGSLMTRARVIDSFAKVLVVNGNTQQFKSTEKESVIMEHLFRNVIVFKWKDNITYVRFPCMHSTGIFQSTYIGTHRFRLLIVEVTYFVRITIF